MKPDIGRPCFNCFSEMTEKCFVCFANATHLILPSRSACPPIHKIGTLLERIRKHAEGTVEHRSHHRAENTALEFVVDEKVDISAAMPGFIEPPGIAEIAKRTVEIFHIDRVFV